jgi:poly-gamma-glutamate synthesis protein (capsule biosynthesis protein)
MAKQQGELTIMAVGDVIVNRPDPPTVFANVADTLRQGDVVVGNLEASLCDRGSPMIGKAELGASLLRYAPHNVAGLVSGGFNVMGLANNHMMDYGPEGLMQTLDTLDAAGLAHAGGGRNVNEAHAPAILERNGTRVALLSYSSVYPPSGYAAGDNRAGIATLKVHTSYQAPDNILYQPGYPALITTNPDASEMQRMLADIDDAKKRADIVMVAFHWGVSWGYGRVVGYQKELGRAAIDAGADLILGSHPHALQGMELYKGKLICYCLGNFVMDGKKSKHFGSDSMILKCYVRDRKLVRHTMIPVFVSSQWQPTLHGPGKRAEIMQRMAEMSKEFGTIVGEDGGEIVVSGPAPGTPPAQRGFAIEPHRGLPVLVDAPLQLPYIIKKLPGFYDDHTRS